MRYCATCTYEGEAEACPNDGTPTAPMPEAPKNTPPPLGLVLEGRYRLDSVVGLGGMGWVMRAGNLRTGHDVAVKMMRRELAENVQAVRRFQREARISASLSHPNTVKVHDFGVSGDGHPFIVMEYLKGKPLDDVVESSGVPDPLRVCLWMVGVCGALAEAHSKGLIHRDLKPANLFLVSVPGGEPFLKVVDFGIAKTDPTLTGESLLTQTGAIVGTPAYMSPEQIRGKELDGRSDLYSLGMILYELLTGAPPCKADSMMELMAWHLTQPAPDLSETGPYGLLPLSLRTLVKSLLARNADERPASAQEVAQRLSSIARELEAAPTAARAAVPSTVLPAPTPTDATMDAPIAQLTPWRPGAAVIPAAPVSVANASAGAPTEGRSSKKGLIVAWVSALLVVAAALVAWQIRTPTVETTGPDTATPASVPKPASGAVQADSPAAPVPAAASVVPPGSDVALETAPSAVAQPPLAAGEPAPSVAVDVADVVDAPAPVMGDADVVPREPVPEVAAPEVVAPAVTPKANREPSTPRARVTPPKAVSAEPTVKAPDAPVKPPVAPTAPEPVLFD